MLDKFNWNWAPTLRRISKTEPARKRLSRDIAELFKLLFDVKWFLFLSQASGLFQGAILTACKPEVASWKRFLLFLCFFQPSFQLLLMHAAPKRSRSYQRLLMRVWGGLRPICTAARAPILRFARLPCPRLECPEEQQARQLQDT